MKGKTSLRYLIFYATSRCNLRCDHCFYTNELQTRDELSLAEIRRVARSVCPLEFVRVTGGEPFLRFDLPLVIEAFVREAGVCRMGIITNGSLPDIVTSSVHEIFQRCPSLDLDVGVSVDGLCETHDRLRNQRGIFNKCRATVENLLGLKDIFPELQVSLVVTVSSANVKELDELFDELTGWGVDRISPNLVRGIARESYVSPVKFDEYERFALKCEAHHLSRSGSARSMVQRAKNRLTREAIRDVLADRPSPIACVAASRIGVLYSDGVVSVCEPLFHQASSGDQECEIDPILGNVRDVGCDLSQVWESEKANEARRWIKHSDCSCTHECFLTASILWGPRQYPRLLRETFKESLTGAPSSTDQADG
ncbi:MAG: radical SAM protein [bacterium]